jgi:hypothetical protein
VDRKAHRKRTPEEKARWQENQRRLESVLERALAELGKTREELEREIGLPSRGEPK